MLLIAHPDVPRSDVLVRRRRHHHTRTRFVRRIIDESAVDTICYDGGTVLYFKIYFFHIGILFIFTKTTKPLGNSNHLN